jgi:hypothetical protein
VTLHARSGVGELAGVQVDRELGSTAVQALHAAAGRRRQAKADFKACTGGLNALNQRWWPNKGDCLCFAVQTSMAGNRHARLDGQVP